MYNSAADAQYFCILRHRMTVQCVFSSVACTGFPIKLWHLVSNTAGNTACPSHTWAGCRVWVWTAPGGGDRGKGQSLGIAGPTAPWLPQSSVTPSVFCSRASSGDYAASHSYWPFTPTPWQRQWSLCIQRFCVSFHVNHELYKTGTLCPQYIC